jgi:hypothetical protein
MKLPRPYIPLSVRLAVVTRQCREAGIGVAPTSSKKAELINACLRRLFSDAKVHLDHDPALCNRGLVIAKVSKGVGKIVGYEPDANDPDFLIYRIKPNHEIKTRVRGDGAQRSDFAQRRYLKRVAKNRTEKKKFKPRRAKHIRRVTCVTR